MFKSHLVLVILSLNIICGQTQECEKTEDNKPVTEEKRLRQDLLCNYNKHFMPMHNRSEEMKVSMIVNVTEYNIYEHKPPTKLYLKMAITLTWNDYFLIWKPEDYSSIKQIMIKADDIWVPEIKPQDMNFFTHGSSILHSKECKLSSNGLVSCVIDHHHSAFCATDDSHWPYNEYHCQLEYMLLMFNGDIINLDWPNVVNETLTVHKSDKHSDWLITGSGSGYYQSSVQRKLAVAEMYFEFDVKKNVGTQMTFWFQGMFVITSLSLMSFWTNIEDTDRIVVCLINIISHVWKIQNMEWEMNNVGHTVPYILCFFRDSMVVAFIILVETLIFKKILSSNKPTPGWLAIANRFMGYGCIRKILFVDGILTTEPKNGEQGSFEDELKFIKQSHQMEKRRIIQLLDRLIFIIFVVVYFIMGLYIITL